MPPTNASAQSYARRQELSSENNWTALRLLSAGTRIVLGFIMLWAFVDKLFGFGYSTPSARSWLNGGSPTNGYLSNSKGWMSGFFQSIAGNSVTDWLFMMALLGVGLALVLGIGLRVAGVSGAILMLMMYAAGTLGVPGTTNPIVDDHILYALLFAGFAFYPMVGNTLGFGRMWQNSRVVEKNKWLE